MEYDTTEYICIYFKWKGVIRLFLCENNFCMCLLQSQVNVFYFSYYFGFMKFIHCWLANFAYIAYCYFVFFLLAAKSEQC